MLNEHILDDIQKRGKLVVGCKMDVPDLSCYDEETDTWSGLEIELAYRTAAELFGVSYRENALLLDPVGAAIQAYRDAQ